MSMTITVNYSEFPLRINIFYISKYKYIILSVPAFAGIEPMTFALLVQCSKF